MKKTLGIFTILCIALTHQMAHAQQQAQYSLYMANNFTLNPAVTGTEDYTDLKVSYRTQWTGFEGAPKTMYISGHTTLNKQITHFDDVKPMAFHAIGGFVYNDDTGPTTQLGAYGSYAYHLPLSKDLTASFGTFVGFQQYRLNENELLFHDDQYDIDDKTLDRVGTKYLPDAHLGVWLYHTRYYVGASLYQLFNNAIDFVDQENTTSTGKLNRHIFVTAGMRMDLNEDLTFVPSFVLRQVSPAPIQMDLNLKLRYKQLFWLGSSYRIKDAMVLLAGTTIKGTYDLAYSYDVTTSEIRNYSNGSHEIIVGYRIQKTEHVAPAQFW